MIDYAIDCFGRVDCLVNSAGSPSPMVSIVDVDMDDYEQVMAVNVCGVMLGMKLVMPHMLAARFRRHHQHFKCCRDQVRLFLAYLHRFKSGGGPSDALRRLGSWREGGSRQQHFARRRATGIFGKNAGVEGSKADKLLDAVKEKFATIQPIPRSDVTDDIGNAAAFLASDRASFIHGHDLVVDGGITLWGQRWNDEIELRASLSSKIKETIDRLNN